MRNSFKKLLICSVSTLALIGCSSNSMSTSGAIPFQAESKSSAYYGSSLMVDSDSYAAEENEMATDDMENGGSYSLVAESPKKIVYTGNVSIETTDYDKTVLQLKDSMAKYGAFFESTSEGKTYNDLRRLNLRIRVPSEHFEEFMGGAEDLGSVTSNTMNREDITKHYNDKTVEKEAKEKQLARLQEMMEKAETIEDMIAIEDRITQIETELNWYKSDLSNMDTDVELSVVDMYIVEVPEYSETDPVRKNATFKDRLMNTIEDSWDGFKEFMENVLFLVIRIFPFAVIAAILIFAWKKLFPNRIRVVPERKRREPRFKNTPEETSSDKTSSDKTPSDK